MGTVEVKKEHSKAQAKTPISIKRPTRKKPKDKPKRPLSAYNFFFKEEREKILKVILADDPKSTDVNDPEDPDFLNDELIGKLKKDDGKVSFEEMGKLIGKRWKSIEPGRHSKYSELAADDTERYKKEMRTYNGNQEAKMRSEALKPPAWSTSSTAGSSSSTAAGSITSSAKGVADFAKASAQDPRSAAAGLGAYGMSGMSGMSAAAAGAGVDPMSAAAAAAGYPYGASAMDMQSLYAMQMGMYGGGYGGYGGAAAMGMGAGQGAGAYGNMAAMYAQQMAMGGYGAQAGMMGYGAGGYDTSALTGGPTDATGAAQAQAQAFGAPSDPSAHLGMYGQPQGGAYSHPGVQSQQDPSQQWGGGGGPGGGQ
mmetsp:Transcript_9296/g.13611  ORF Transcript_9296/g.13611 Transcript_9296/m.13611 type:complete len:367 (-) Transcript_9296:237-1337(-)|eukprot:CAMPEP_0194031226 /NCGR_PEP_ID=MMETSP0009_2-20130614/4447_1 /TAXON_ID=210454 /ORGANISM="Grammatophora oceanica, Strain CCMP 410" /LENGTH=366 /DNA_ID=CAMNT_0038671317 /DNA_START=248 /DNA_END=1348 /DNA_ORIENTATION=+